MGSAASTASPSTSEVSLHRPLLLLVCHSVDEPALRSLLFPVQPPDQNDDGTDTQDVLVLTDKHPRDVEARARVLGAAAAALVAVGPALQRSSALLEALSFLKDRRKRVVTGPIAFFARPSGAVGAICVAYGQWLDQLFCPPDSGELADHSLLREELRTSYELLRTTHVSSALELELELDRQAADDTTATVENGDAITDGADDKPTLVILSTSNHSDGESASGPNDAARIVHALSTLESQGLSLAGVPLSVSPSDPLPASLSTILRASVVVVVVTADLSDAADARVRAFRVLVEAARRARKPLLPVKEARAGVLSTDGWLSLVLAGRLWFEVDVRAVDALHTPYAQLPDCPCRVDDSCPATDLLLSANALLEAPWRQRALEGADEEGGDQWEAAMLDAAKESAMLLGVTAEQVQSVLARVDEALARVEEDSNGDREGWRTLRDELGVPVTSSDVSTMLEEDFRLRANEWPAPSFSPSPSVEDATSNAGATTKSSVNRIRYEVRRVGFATLPSVVDARGVLLPGSAPDVLLSYQWAAQARVLAVHQQGRVRGLRAWLDVFGHMQGNVNAAMARAVEGAACVVVFASDRYASSANCRLECEYAARRGKPLLLAFLEDDPRTFALPAWMADAVSTSGTSTNTSSSSSSSSVVDAVTVVDLRGRADGKDVDAMDALFAAVRALAALRAVQDHKWPPVRCDGSLRLFAATAALRHAARANTSAGTGARAGVPCSRCGVLFRPPSEPAAGGGACRKHSAYYMGGKGGLLAGRWVCCNELAEDGPGCVPAPHMATARRWTRDGSYGTHTWTPDADE